MEQKGEKLIQVLGIEDKRQPTMLVSSSIVEELLFLQVIFANTTKKDIATSKRKKNEVHSR